MRRVIPSPKNSSLAYLPSGDDGVRRTLEFMTAEITRGSHWPPLRPLALAIVADSPERDFADMARRVYFWVIAHMTFRNDNFGTETVSAVKYMVEQIERTGQAYEDCDGYAVLIGALCKVLGFPVKVRAIRFDGVKNYQHVVCVVFIRGRGWAELDGSMRPGQVTNPLRVAEMDSGIAT